MNIGALVAAMMFVIAATVHAESLVPQATWSNEMANVLPAAICRDGSYFRVCFEAPAEECHESASVSTSSCLRQYKSQMPDPLEQPEDGSHWGQLVGSCAAALYISEHKDKKVGDAKCEDIENWR
jgi:hypothetical protein